MADYDKKSRSPIAVLVDREWDRITVPLSPQPPRPPTFQEGVKPDVESPILAMQDSINEMVMRQIQRNNEAVEAACLSAIMTGVHGVEVRNHEGGTVTARVSPDVPYMEVHYIGGTSHDFDQRPA